MEELLAKQIEGRIRGIRMGTKTPEDANVGILLNKLRGINEYLYDEYIERYKTVLRAYNEKLEN